MDDKQSMKRYLLFLFDSYYPSGGWNDFASSHDTIVEALQEDRSHWDHYQVVDKETGEIIQEG